MTPMRRLKGNRSKIGTADKAENITRELDAQKKVLLEIWSQQRN